MNIFKKIASWFKPKEETVSIIKPCKMDVDVSVRTLKTTELQWNQPRPTINTRAIQAQLPIKSTSQTTTTVVETQNNNDDLLLGALAAATILGNSASYDNDFSSSCDGNSW